MFSGTATFLKTQFTDHVDFSGATFSDKSRLQAVNFLESASFDNTDFCGPIALSRTTFSRLVNFSETRFLSSFSLMNAVFEEPAVFSNLTFPGSIDFRNTEFSHSAHFDDATFTSDVNLQNVAFSNFANFGGATFSGSFHLFDVEFSDFADFGGTTFSGSVDIAFSTFSGVANFSSATFVDDAEISFVTFARIADFDDVTLSGALEFMNVTFPIAAAFGGTNGSRPIRLVNCTLSSSCLVTVGNVSMVFDRLVATHPLVIDRRTTHGFLHSDVTVSILRSTLIDPVTITANVRLTESSFRGSTGLDQLRFQGDPDWRTKRGRTIIHDEYVRGSTDISPRELESLYRQLRAGLEASKAAPAAADFFYGEMEARRAHTRWQGQPVRLGRLLASRYLSLRWWLLSLYKWCAGYGVRAWRAFASYFVTVIGIGLLFYFLKGQLIDLDATVKPDVDTYLEAMTFSLRNSINLFRAPDTGLEPLGIMVLVLGRLLGVAFLALAVIGLRSHTER